MSELVERYRMVINGEPAGKLAEPTWRRQVDEVA
jgi:hypothetical protein